MSGSNNTGEVIILPCLGQEYELGKELKTEEFVVTQKTTKRDLRNALQQYKLPFSGSKTILLQRLRDYSKDHNAWLSLFQPRKKRTRGVHTGRESHSTKRIREQFGTEESGEKITYQSRKSVARVQRVLEDKDREFNNGWSKAVLSAFGIGEDLRPHKRQRVGEPSSTIHAPPLLASGTSTNDATRLTTSDNNLSDAGSLLVSHEKDHLSVRMRRMEHKISATNENLAQRVDSVEANMTAHMQDIKALITGATTSSTRHDGLRRDASVLLPTQANKSASGTNQPYTIAGVVSAQSTPASSADTPVTAASEGTTATTTTMKTLGTAHLGDELFAFDTSKVPDPPTVHLSKDIDRLCREWHTSSLLTVDGHKIPVKYWPEFYKKANGAKPNAWQALRVEWGNWKYIAEERERHHDGASFWHKFSNKEGEPLLYKAILEILAKQRNANAVQDATNARSFFGGDLDHPDAKGAFSYVKSGKTFLATKDDVIARRWQTLLKDDPDISSRWAVVQTAALTTGSNASSSS